MKRIRRVVIRMAVCLAVALSMASCGTMMPGAGQAGSGDNGSQSMLGSLLGSLIGNNTAVTPQRLAGTWVYASPDCRFTSENALAQAGGEVAAASVEQKLADIYTKIGIVPGKFSISFTADGDCTIMLGSRQIGASYTLNPETRDITIVDNTGLLKISGKVYYSYTTLTILFDAQKLMSTLKMVAALTGQASSTMGTLSSVLDNFNGMMIGMNMKK